MAFRKSHRRISPMKIIHPHIIAGAPVLAKERENPFSNTVLIGNWFEERFESKKDRRAIAPGIYGESQCSQDNSVYRNDFKQPIKMGHREEYEEFITWKQRGFSNRFVSQQPNIQLWDGEQFLNNLTTSKDVMYRILPQMEKNNTEVAIGKRRVNDDFMRSFGNSTKTGLLRWMECERRRKNDMPIDVSHYKNNFKPIKVTEKRILHKAQLRKTSI